MNTKIERLILELKNESNLIKNLEENLHKAACYGCLTPLRILLDIGTNIDAVDINGRTALHFAAAKGHAVILTELLEYKPNIAAADINGRTALDFAAANGHAEIVQILLQHQEKIKAADNNRQTALNILLAQLHRVSLVKAQNKDGKTDLPLDEKNGFEKAIQPLSQNPIKRINNLIQDLYLRTLEALNSKTYGRKRETFAPPQNNQTQLSKSGDQTPSSQVPGPEKKETPPSHTNRTLRL